MKILIYLINFLICSSTNICKNCKYFIPLSKIKIQNKFIDRIPERHIIDENYGVCTKFYYETVHKVRNSEEKCGKDGLFFIDKNKTSSDYNIFFENNFKNVLEFTVI